MHVADFQRDSGTLLVRTSKAGKMRHIELTAEGLEFFNEITAGRPGAICCFTATALLGESHINNARFRSLPRRTDHTRGIVSHAAPHPRLSDDHGRGAPDGRGANLGHADTRMVEKHYGHMATSYVARRSAPQSHSASAIRPTSYH